MPANKGLQIAAAAADAALTPTQRRFNTLIRQIEQARRQLADWQVNVPLYQQAHQQLLQPLLVAAAAARRQWIAALDALSDQPGWSRLERRTVGDLVRGAAGDLLSDDPDDAALRTLYDKHGDVDFETEQAEALRGMKGPAEAMTGLDLGDDQRIESQKELLERLQQRFAAEAEAAGAADAARAADKAARRPTAAQRRREAEAQQATQSVREIYRKLASALHPDREIDETRRAGKTALMQQANQAYAANDLLALLELQLGLEQVDAARLGQASDARLKHYNTVLAEQLEQLKVEIERTELRFTVDFRLPPGPPRRPDRLFGLIDAEKRHLLAVQTRLQAEMQLLQRADKLVIKRWLKARRDALRFADRDDDGAWF